MEQKGAWSCLPGWTCLNLSVQSWQQRALLFLTSLSKVAPGAITSPDGLIHPVISTQCSPLLCSCAHVMHWNKLLWCKPCFAICGMPWLAPVPDGFQGQSLSRSKSMWPACRAVLEQHRTYWHEQNSLGAYGVHWQGHRSSSSSLLSDRLARKRRLAHIYGTAAGKDRRTCQQGPADRRLAVWLGWQGAAGWTSASRDAAYELGGFQVKVQ